MRNHIQSDQRRTAEERIDVLLLEGLVSGDPIAVTPEYWEEKKLRLARKLVETRPPAPHA